MKIVYFIVAFLLILCGLIFFLNSLPPITKLTFNGHDLFCEKADTADKRAVGLMNRSSLDKNAGMLFVYQNEDIRTFHMANVKMPLSIVFADRNGIIVHMTEMITDRTTTYSSEKATMYAVEANKGWFTSHQVKIGDRIEGLIK
jgi:uncharacterized membrane protein (UPF0127 family)